MLTKLLKRHDTIYLRALSVCKMDSSQDESVIAVTDIDLAIQEAFWFWSQGCLNQVICKAQPGLEFVNTYWHQFKQNEVVLIKRTEGSLHIGNTFVLQIQSGKPGTMSMEIVDARKMSMIATTPVLDRHRGSSHLCIWGGLWIQLCSHIIVSGTVMLTDPSVVFFQPIICKEIFDAFQSYSWYLDI